MFCLANAISMEGRQLKMVRVKVPEEANGTDHASARTRGGGSRSAAVRIVASEAKIPEWRARLRPVVLDAFAEADFHRVDMRSIADKAGMSLHTIYRYFGDKEKLLFAFIDDWLIDLPQRGKFKHCRVWKAPAKSCGRHFGATSIITSAIPKSDAPCL